MGLLYHNIRLSTNSGTTYTYFDDAKNNIEAYSQPSIFAEVAA